MYENTPHRRYNPLTDEWILVSPHRTNRPWQGQVETIPDENLPEYDPNCYLCPGNSRAGGIANPPYTQTYVFENDFAALMPVLPNEAHSSDEHPLFASQAERGICRVICFSPRHDLTLALLSPAELRVVVDLWGDQTRELTQHEWLHYVQIFENRGEMMGASNPHPHGQLWATERIPMLIQREDAAQLKHYQLYETTLLSDVAKEERKRGVRVVWQDEHWVIVVPFWAVWPFETLLIPRRPVKFIHDLTDAEADSLAEALSALTIRYDNLFKTRFPYSMGIHQAPVNTPHIDHWHLHLHFFPPLLRSATVRKFMVGYELLASPQRDITAEQAAERLREVSGTRYHMW
jgi:UDPglucose--hexose-1-phosphate uridylyltransferase